MKSWFSRQRSKLRGAAKIGIAGAGAVIVALVVLCFSLWREPAPRTIDFTELTRLTTTGEGVAAVRVEGERFQVDLTGGAREIAIVGEPATRHDLVSRFAAAGVPVAFEGQEQAGAAKTLGVVLPLVGFLVVGAVVLGVHRRRGSGHFSTYGRDGASAVRFDDVAGVDEAKDALAETVEFLRAPEAFGRLGGRAPRGVLLTGEPGTGKTLLARAVASEARVPFLSSSGSAFQEMFVGVGAQRVRGLFTEARRVAPCIVFIDEIDAVGRARARHGDSATADHDQTLNQLLVEMDGFDHTSGIVVIASTNRADVLDPALLRAGRFDRQIAVPLPDLRGRAEILAVHARPIALDESVDLTRVARGTPGFSGADLANLLNEAAILAAREGASGVEVSHIDRARDLVMMGAERRGFMVDEDDRRATAIHEAGHVAVGVTAPHADPVHKVSILPRGRSLGATHSLPERDHLMLRREYLEDQICLMMGGRAAEMVLLGTQTAGAADDLQRASMLARKMVAELGMSDLGPITVGPPGALQSQALLDRVEDAARRLVESELARACRIVEARRGEIEVLVRRLLEEDTLDSDAIRACFDGAS